MDDTYPLIINGNYDAPRGAVTITDKELLYVLKKGTGFYFHPSVNHTTETIYCFNLNVIPAEPVNKYTDRIKELEAEVLRLKALVPLKTLLEI